MMWKDQESPNKDKENHMSNARRKYDLINSNTSLSESCSAGVRVKIIFMFHKMN